MAIAHSAQIGGTKQSSSRYALGTRGGAVKSDRYNARMQVMITKNMRKVLIEKLDYLSDEVDDMDPQIAAVVIEKSLPRPRAGMPVVWRKSIRRKRSGDSPFTAASGAVARTLGTVLSFAILPWKALGAAGRGVRRNPKKSFAAASALLLVMASIVKASEERSAWLPSSPSCEGMTARIKQYLPWASIGSLSRKTSKEAQATHNRPASDAKGKHNVDARASRTTRGRTEQDMSSKRSYHDSRQEPSGKRTRTPHSPGKDRMSSESGSKPNAVPRKRRNSRSSPEDHQQFSSLRSGRRQDSKDSSVSRGRGTKASPQRISRSQNKDKASSSGSKRGRSRPQEYSELSRERRAGTARGDGLAESRVYVYDDMEGSDLDDIDALDLSDSEDFDETWSEAILSDADRKPTWSKKPAPMPDPLKGVGNTGDDDVNSDVIVEDSKTWKRRSLAEYIPSEEELDRSTPSKSDTWLDRGIHRAVGSLFSRGVKDDDDTSDGDDDIDRR